MADGDVSLNFKAEGAEKLAADTLALANALSRLVRFSEQLNKNFASIPSVDIKISGETGKIADDFERIAKAFERIPDEIRIAPFTGDSEALANRVTELEKNLDNVSESADEAAENLEEVGSESQNASPKVSRFSKACDALKGALSAVGTVAKSIIGVLKVLATAMSAGFAAISAGVVSSINYARKMSISAKAIGASAGDVALLSEAFKAAGVESVDAANLIAKMQRRIAMSNISKEYKRPFDILGIDANSLRGMGAVEQIEAIGAAVRNLTSQEDRVAALMGLFEEQGARLSPLFLDAEALSKAAVMLGSSGKILDRSSAAFERVGYLLTGITTKIRDFFLGVAQGVLEPLNVALTKLSEIDTAAIGERFGDMFGDKVKAAFEAIMRGQFLKFLTTSIEYAFAVGSKTIYEAIVSASKEFKKQIIPFYEEWQTAGHYATRGLYSFGNFLATGNPALSEQEKKDFDQILKQQKREQNLGVFGMKFESIESKFNAMMQELTQGFNERFQDIQLPKTEPPNTQIPTEPALTRKNVERSGFNIPTDALRRVGGFIGGVLPMGAMTFEKETAKNTRDTATATKQISQFLNNQNKGTFAVAAVYS